MRALITFGLAIAFGALPIRAAERPNLILLLVDDLRWNALGYMGHRVVQTPNIDRLAGRGCVFTNAFVTTSICAVSRASIFTGQWERRHGIDDFAKGLNGTAWSNTYPARLRQAGYHTGFVGKWGVGNLRETTAKAEAFDYWRGLPGQAGAFFFEKNDPTKPHATARFGNQAIEFMRTAPRDRPFCLSLSFNAVHARDNKPREFHPDPRDEELYLGMTLALPPTATEEAFRRLPVFVQESEGRRRWHWRFDDPEKAQRTLRDYYRLITGVDREVGRIMNELERSGRGTNTVIVFTSDNGYTLGDRGMADKWFMYEESIRVPLILMDPRVQTDGRARSAGEMVLNVDLAPTLLELAGVEIPSVMQGRSLVPFLRGEIPEDQRREFFYEYHSVPDRIPPSEGVRTERWKYIRWIKSDPVVEELYDLKNDPLEERNLAGSDAHGAVLDTLRHKWARYRTELQ